MSPSRLLSTTLILVLVLSTSALVADLSHAGPESTANFNHRPIQSTAPNSPSAKNDPVTSFKGVHGTASLTAVVNAADSANWNGHVPTTSVPSLATSQVTNSAQSSSTKLAQTLSVPATSSVVEAIGFQGLNQAQSCSCVPPDVQVASGPSQVVEMVNVLGAIYTKQGTLIQKINMTTFFAAGKNRMSDPKIIYDNQTGRWFASIIIGKPSGFNQGGNVSVAVSMTTDATGKWSLYLLNAGGELPDQPIIGVSDDKFIVSVNAFGTANGAQIWVLNKNQMLAGLSTVDMTVFGPQPTLCSVHPVQSLSPTTTEYLVSKNCAAINYGTLQLFAVVGQPPGPVVLQLTNLPISTVNLPPAGTQEGLTYANVQVVDTNDGRVLDAAWNQGKLWLTFIDACTPTGDAQQRSCDRIIEVDTSSTSIVQDFDFGISGFFLNYAALRPNGSGDVDMIYGYSASANSTCCFPSLAITGRSNGDPANTLAPSKKIVSGTGAATFNRFGDYFGAAVDGSDPSLVWVAGEYVNGTGGGFWSTFIASMRVVSFSMSMSPSYLTLAPGQSGTSTLNVTSIGGFSGTVTLTTSISPTVTNGPTVSLKPSVTLSSGGSATAKLSITTKTRTPSGSYTVTVAGSSNGTNESITLPFTVGPDFTIAASPASLSFHPGLSSSTTFTITSLNGQAGTVQLAGSSTPLGISISFNQPSLKLASGGTNSSTVTISAAFSSPQGAFTITLVASLGSQSHTTTLVVTIQSDFTLIASNMTPIIPAGTSGLVTIQLIGLDGFSGTVNLNAAIQQPGDNSTATLSKNSLTISAGQRATSILNITIASFNLAGSYPVNVTGTSGLFSHFIVVTAKITDFSLSASPAALGMIAGSSKNSTIGISSPNGDSATLSAQVNPVGPRLTFFGNILNVAIPSGTAQGSLFTITVTGFDGITSHSINMTAGVMDVSTTINPSTLTLNKGTTGEFSELFRPTGDFFGIVFVKTTVSSPGLNSSDSLNELLMGPNSIIKGPLALTAITPGTYTVNVTTYVQGLPIDHTILLTVNVLSGPATPIAQALPVSSLQTGDVSRP